MKHNKTRNLGIIVECLIKEYVFSLLEKKSHKQRVIWNIFDKYFLQETSILSKEMQLFNILSETNCKDQSSAAKILNAFYKYSKQLPQNDIEKSKTKLLAETEATIGLNFLNHKLSNYKILASIQQLLNNIRFRKHSVLTEAEQIKIEETIIENLLVDKKKKQLFEGAKNDQVDSLVVEIAINSWFRDIQDLSEVQKAYLRKFFKCSGDDLKLKGLLKEFQTLLPKMLTELTDSLKRFDDEKFIKITNQAIEKANLIKENLIDISALEKYFPDLLVLTDIVTLTSQVKKNDK